MKSVRELKNGGPLRNVTRDLAIAQSTFLAESLLYRTKGLLGESSLPAHSALWIQNCPSIHTFFMRFDIDVVFVDKNLKIQKIYTGMGPWRMTFPNYSFDSVFEFQAGSISSANAQQGDQLHVGN